MRRIYKPRETMREREKERERSLVKYLSKTVTIFVTNISAVRPVATNIIKLML